VSFLAGDAKPLEKSSQWGDISFYHKTKDA